MEEPTPQQELDKVRASLDDIDESLKEIKSELKADGISEKRELALRDDRKNLIKQQENLLNKEKRLEDRITSTLSKSSYSFYLP